MSGSQVVLDHVLYFKSCERLLIRQDLFALDISPPISFKTSLSDHAVADSDSDRTTIESITRLKYWESFSLSLSSLTPFEGHSSSVNAVALSLDEKSLRFPEAQPGRLGCSGTKSITFRRVCG
jgi:hypothetical protein